jgi:hypothetical protein
VTAIPTGWIYVADFGIRQIPPAAGAIVASVGLGQDTLEAEDGLASYIEKQMKLIEGYLTEAKFGGPQPAPFAGVDEANLLFTRHRIEAAGSMLHAQTYVRSGTWLGIVTLTVLEAQVKTVRPDYEAFVKGLHILRDPASAPARP